MYTSSDTPIRRQGCKVAVQYTLFAIMWHALPAPFAKDVNQTLLTWSMLYIS